MTKKNRIKIKYFVTILKASSEEVDQTEMKMWKEVEKESKESFGEQYENKRSDE